MYVRGEWDESLRNDWVELSAAVLHLHSDGIGREDEAVETAKESGLVRGWVCESSICWICVDAPSCLHAGAVAGEVLSRWALLRRPRGLAFGGDITDVGR